MIVRRVSTAFILLLFGATPALADEIIETTGEAAIIRGDLSSARLEAISRARWEAVAQVAGVAVDSSSFVNNFTLVDDAIIKRTAGVISKSTVIAESWVGEVYSVRIRATVGRDPARAAMSQVARDRAIAVYIPSVYPDSSTKETNAVSETLIKSLTAAGYEIVDVADIKLGISSEQLRNALKNNNFVALRALLYEQLTNTLLVGAINVSPIARQGQRDSAGTLPFDMAKATLSYRLVGGDATGLRTILASGQLGEKGTGPGMSQAAENSISELAKSAVGALVNEVKRNVAAKAPRLRVKVDGVLTLSSDQAVRRALSDISFVAKVDGQRFGDYIVEYQERPIYLATSLGRVPGFRVTEFTPSSILARFEEITP